MTITCGKCGALARPGAQFCPSCGTRLAPAPRTPDAPKAPAGGGGKPVWLIVAALMLVGVFLYLFVEHLPGGEHPVIAAQPLVGDAATSAAGHVEQSAVETRLEGDRLILPLETVRRDRIVAFDYSDGTVTVPLLAFISGEGRLVTAYRMCEPCNSKKFSIDGDRLSCGNCETQWSLNTLEGLQGTCQKYPPEPFPSSVEGDRVIIPVAQIKSWKIRL